MNGKKRTHIVAAIIFNKSKDEIFISKRDAKAHQGGLWEFPGGKVETGESTEQAIKRELFEELGIEVTSFSLFQHLEHDYPDKSLSFDFFSVTDFNHQPFGKEGQQAKWVPIKQLGDYAFPQANIPILNRVIQEFVR